MIGYHCQVLVAADMFQVMSFPVFQMTWLLISGWLSGDTLCRPGGWM